MSSTAEDGAVAARAQRRIHSQQVYSSHPDPPNSSNSPPSVPECVELPPFPNGVPREDAREYVPHYLLPLHPSCTENRQSSSCTASSSVTPAARTSQNSKPSTSTANMYTRPQAPLEVDRNEAPKGRAKFGYGRLLVSVRG